MARRLFSNQSDQMFEFKSGNKRTDILEVFESALTKRNTEERLEAMAIVAKKPSVAEWVNGHARISTTDRYGYLTHIVSPEIVTRTGVGSYAFQNCMAALMQNFGHGSPLSDDQFGSMLACLLNHVQRDTYTYYMLPADYQLVDKDSKKERRGYGTADPDDFLNRCVRDLGALEIDRSPNMFHPPSEAVMLRLCLLYNPNLLKFVDCIPMTQAWTHSTTVSKHFTYVAKHLVDAQLAEPTKPIDKMAEVVSTPEKVQAKKKAQQRDLAKQQMNHDPMWGDIAAAPAQRAF